MLVQYFILRQPWCKHLKPGLFLFLFMDSSASLWRRSGTASLIIKGTWTCVHLTELNNIIYQNMWLWIQRDYSLLPFACVCMCGERGSVCVCECVCVCVWSCPLILSVTSRPSGVAGEQVNCYCCCRVRLCCGSVYGGRGDFRGFVWGEEEVCCRKRRWKVYNYLQERVLFFPLRLLLLPPHSDLPGTVGTPLLAVLKHGGALLKSFIEQCYFIFIYLFSFKKLCEPFLRFSSRTLSCYCEFNRGVDIGWVFIAEPVCTLPAEGLRWVRPELSCVQWTPKKQILGEEPEVDCVWIVRDQRDVKISMWLSVLSPATPSKQEMLK